jgi:hypothetical protein
MAQMTREFVNAIEKVRETRGHRAQKCRQELPRRFSAEEVVLFIGKAQERATVIRTERRKKFSYPSELRLARQV